MVLYVCFVLACFDFFKYVGYDWVYLSWFKADWLCYTKCFDVGVCFCTLCILLDIQTSPLSCISQRVPCFAGEENSR